MNGDGTVGATEYCGYYPPGPVGEPFCPWGLAEDRLYVFVDQAAVSPGNRGAISACGTGVNNYRDCVSGDGVSAFWGEGTSVLIRTQTGQGALNATDDELAERYSDETVVGGVYQCDVLSTPSTDPASWGMDPDGRASAYDTFVYGLDVDVCAYRLVAVPIIHHFPPEGASEDILVLGVATYGIAGWDRRGNPMGNARGDDDTPCDDEPAEPLASTGFSCGGVWGYLMRDVRPPNFLLEQITNSNNPFAPLMIAMVE